MRTSTLLSLNKGFEASTIEEAFAKSPSLNFEVSKRPMYYAGLDGQMIESKEKIAIVRDDNDLQMGTAGHDYGVLQYKEGMEVLNAFMIGDNKFVSGGTTLGGKRGYITAQIGGEWLIGGREEEKHLTYLTAKMSHDCSSSFELFVFVNRKICSNGMRMNVKTNSFKTRHSGNILERTKQAGRILEFIQEAQDSFKNKMETFMAERIDNEYIINFLETLLPSTEEKVSTRLANTREEIRSLIVRGTGNIGKTKYDVLNGVTEYVDHVQSGRITTKGLISFDEETIEREQRFERSNFGTGLRLKEQALALLS